MKQYAVIIIIASMLAASSCNRNDLYDNSRYDVESLLLSNMGLTVVIQSAVAGPTNSPIPITIVFKNPVTGFDVTDIVVANGTAGGFAGAGDTYTANIAPLADGIVTVDIPDGAAQDAEGNLSKAARRFTAVYDTMVALSSVTIGSNNPAPSLAMSGNRVTLSFTAGEALIAPAAVINGVGATVAGGPVNWTAYRVMNAGDPESPVTFTISGIQDLAGNTAANVSATTDASTVTYDMTAPSITPVNIASSNAFSALAIVGDTVTLTFTADEDIQAPSVTIAGRAATLAGGPAVWTASLAIPALAPEGLLAFAISNVRDLSGNPVSNVTATTDASSVTLDKTAPSITSITSGSPNATYGTSSNIDVTINFNENVELVGGTLDLTLDTGAVVNIAPFGPSMMASGIYTVAAGNTSGDLNVVGIALGGGAVLRDVPGNNASLALPAGNNLGNNSDIVIDTIPPAILSITSSTANGTYGSGAAINIMVNFSKNVTLAGNTLDLILDTGVVVSIAPFGPALSASGTYTVAAGNTSGDLNVSSVGLAGGATLRDAFNNDTSLLLPAGQNLADNKAIVVDTGAPYIISFTSSTADGSYGSGAVIDVTVNFSDNMTLAGNNLDLTLDTGAVVSIAPFGPSSNASGTYTVAAGHASGDLNVTGVGLAGGATLRDGLNNDAVLGLPAGNNLADNQAIVIDAVAPVITGITSATINGTYRSGSIIDVRINFSKNVTLTVGTLDVTLDTGDVASIAPFGSAMSANATYTVGAGDTSGDLNVTGIALAGGGILRDAFNNDTDLTLPAGQNLADNKALVVDGVLPIVTPVSIASDNADPARATTGDTVTVTFTANEDLQAPTATIGGSFAVIAGGPLVWTASYTLGAMADGTATFQISNVRDLAGNTIADITAVTDISSVNVDTTPPSVTPVSIVSSNADSTMAMLGDTVTVSFTSGEALQTPMVTIAGAAAVVGGGPLLWTATYVMALGDAEGGVPFQISGISDLTGNTIGNISAVTDGSSVTYDRTVPAITPVSIASDNANPLYAKTGDLITLTFSADENIQTPTVTIDGNAAIVAGGPLNWTATYTMLAADPEGTVTFSITNVMDLSGNMVAAPVNAVTDASSVTYYKTAPSLSPVTIASSNPNPSLARVGNTVTLTFTANRAITTPTVVIKGTAAAVAGGPLAWTATRTMIAADTDGGVNFTISTIQDLAGNAAADVSATTDASAVTFDKSPPVISTAETMDADGDGRIDHYRVTFNENVTDSTFPGYAANSQGSLQGQWVVAGYANLVMAHGAAAPEADTANDAVIYLKYSEAAVVGDTDVKPDLTTGVSPAVTDRAGNAMTQVNSAAVAEADGAAPVVVTVVGAPGVNTAVVTFSEAVDNNNADGGACTGSVMAGNLDYFNNSGGDASSITGMSDADGCDCQVEVLTNVSLAAADLEVDTIGARLSQVYDSANISALNGVKTINGFLGKLVCRFDTTSAGADVPNDVTNFPLLIRLTDPAIIDAVQAGAPDIRFIDRDGSSLKYQIERWDQALDLADVWVLVPQIDGNNASDYITMFYNDVNDGTIPDGQDAQGVFDTANGFAGVWHLNEGAVAPVIFDTTFNTNNGTNTNTTNEINGIIGQSRYFDGATAYVDCGNDPTLDITGQLTLSVWTRSDDGEFATNYRIISKMTTTDGYELITYNQTELIDLLASGGGLGTASADLSGMGDAIDTGWHYFAATINNTTAEIFFDGIISTTDGSIGALQSGGSKLVYGASTAYAYKFQGSIDEVRVESVQRTPEWIKLCYENQRLAQRLIKYWFDPAWQYRKRISVQGSKVADNLLLFPVYVRLDDLGSEFFNHVKPDGTDIVVTAGNGRTMVPRELVTINTGAQTGELWFRAPLLQMSDETVFYVYYGNPSAAETNDPAVWSNGYGGVWHLNGNGFDSSPSGNHGAVNGAPVATAGQMGGAITFDGGDDFLDITTSPSLALAGTVTLSAWFRPVLGTEPEMRLVSKRFNPAAINGYGLTVDPSVGDLFAYTQGGSNAKADMAQVEISTTWYNYSTAVISPNGPMAQCAIYFNGLDRTTDTVLAPLLADGTPLNIGRMPDGTSYFSGDIDEVRVSSVVRSAEWVQTEFNNQGDPMTFFSIAAEEEVDGP